jgi:pimeloyl-ACP methyl ester carboxylesterase
VVDDCRHDLAAWVEWLRHQVGPRVGLLGHSLGAVKCLYALAHEPQLQVGCVAAVSPPRLSYSWFCTSAQAEPFLQTYTQAEQHVQEGRAGTLMEVKLPLPFVIAAGGYVEKYGPDERYNFLRFLPGISCPVLITLGSIEVENNMAFQGVPEALAELAGRPSRLTCQVIAGADHFYTSARPALLACLEGWLRSAS